MVTFDVINYHLKQIKIHFLCLCRQIDFEKWIFTHYDKLKPVYCYFFMIGDLKIPEHHVYIYIYCLG